jgi:hypothetical protein
MHFNESLIILVLSVPFILMVIAILDLVKRNFNGPSEKVLWIFLIILIPVLGVLLYYIIGRRSSSRYSGKVSGY